jgi:hypothetical protein
VLGLRCSVESLPRSMPIFNSFNNHKDTKSLMPTTPS